MMYKVSYSFEAEKSEDNRSGRDIVKRCSGLEEWYLSFTIGTRLFETLEDATNYRDITLPLLFRNEGCEISNFSLIIEEVE